VMDQTVAPVVKLISPATETTVTGSWVDFNTWKGSFSVGSTNEGDDNYVQVTGAEDWAGNPMEAYESDHFTVDTTKPKVISVSVIPDPVPAGTQSIIFSVTFDESVTDPVASFGKSSPYTTYSVELSGPTGRTWTGIFEPSEALAAGEYHVRVSGATDRVGNVMDPDTSYTFTVITGKVEQVIGPAGGTVSMEGVVDVEIPEGALDTQQTISIEMVTDPPATEPLTATSICLRLGPSGLVFSKSVTITVYYTDGDIEGMNEDNLTIYVWDEVASKWRRVGGTVYPDENKVVFTVNHFSIFLLAEEAAAEYTFDVTLSRNPFLSSEGTFFMYKLPKTGKVTLKIYDATGDLVRTLLDGVSRDAGLYEADVKWDGDDDFGSFVGTGIYIYKFEVKYDGGGSDKEINTVGVIK